MPSANPLFFTDACRLSWEGVCGLAVDAAAPRCRESFTACASPRYPTPPAAPPKDGYIYESEDESQSPLRQAPARVFRNGKLKIHKTYNGPVPLTYGSMY